MVTQEVKFKVSSVKDLCHLLSSLQEGDKIINWELLDLGPYPQKISWESRVEDFCDQCEA